MPTISLGKVALTWRGAYDNATDYTAQDIVSYNGSTYIAKTSTTGFDPTNTSKWDLLAQGIEGVAANDGDIVYFDGSQLQALSIGTAGSVLRVGTDGLPKWEASEARSGMRAIKIQDERQAHTYRRNFAVMSDGTIRAWGRGTNYVLGQGNTTTDRKLPIRVAFPSTAPAMVDAWMSYDYFGCSIDAEGGFWTWGGNAYGECGDGSTSTKVVPYCVTSDSNASNGLYGKVVVDYAPCTSQENYLSSLVLTDDGYVYASGYNGYGQLGQGDTTQRNWFTQVPLIGGTGDSAIVQIARGRERYTPCMALTAGGEVYSWGYNAVGELGHGDTTQRNIPTKINYFSTNSIVVKSIGMAGETAWAIDTDDNLYTWGYNGYGQLGHSNTTNVYTPTFATDNVAQVSSRGVTTDYNNTFVVKTDGSVWSVGDNTYGSLGVAADTTDRSSFNECMKSDGTTGFTNAYKVCVGGTGSYNFTIVLCTDGSVWGCGYSGNGQIGTGSMSGTNYYFNETLIHRRKAIDIHTFGNSSEGGLLILMDDGQLMGCGYAANSQFPEYNGGSMAVPSPIIM
jgi:alpha-tubulin suppressor-like RCC1 family protein